MPQLYKTIQNLFQFSDLKLKCILFIHCKWSWQSGFDKSTSLLDKLCMNKEWHQLYPIDFRCKFDKNKGKNVFIYLFNAENTEAFPLTDILIASKATLCINILNAI